MSADRHGQDGLMVANIAQYRVWRHTGRPAFTPLPERNHRRQEVESFGGQSILHAAPIVGAGAAVQDARLGQAGEAVGQNVPRNADLCQDAGRR